MKIGKWYTEGARAYNSANQSIPNATNTVAAWDSESYDTDNIHDTVTNNSRLTCKTAGKYLIVLAVEWSSNTTGDRQAGLRVNGGVWLPWDMRATSSGGLTRATVTAIYALSVNDYVEAIVNQNSGGALNLDSPSSFSMQRIG